MAILIISLVPATATENNEISINQSDQTSIKIVATMNFLGDFSKALLGNKADITSLIGSNQDPHFYEPDASDLTAMSEADLILGFGSPEFDEWLLDYIDDSGDSSLQDKTKFVVDAEELEEIDPLTGVANPHIWLDPAYAKIMVNNTAQILIDSNLITLEDISDNWISYLTKLNQLIDLMENTATEQNWKGKKVVVDHPSFFYFLTQLGFDRIGAIEEKEGEEASPQHIEDITEQMNDQNINLIVASATQAGSDVEELARNTGALVAYLTPLPGIDGAENYTEMIKYNLNALINPSTITEEAPLNSIWFFSLSILAIPILRKSRNIFKK
jgi:ABC-type Zn uptake system ZnuABC Zn-binding protein ZnuA